MRFLRLFFLTLSALLASATLAIAEIQTFGPLSANWNLIVFQVAPTNPSPTAVFGSLPELQSAWTYDTASAKWSRYVKSADSARDAIENSVPGVSIASVAVGKAYWIYLAGARTSWSVNGSLPANVPAVDFKAGWNLVGIPTGTTAPLTEPVNLLSVLTKAGFDYDTILRWEASTQSYKHYSTANNRNTTSQEVIPLDPNAGIMANVLVPSQLKPNLVATVRTDIDVEPTGNFPAPEDLNISNGAAGTTPRSVADQDQIVFFEGEDVQTLSLSNNGGGIMLWDVDWNPTENASLKVPWLTVSTSSTEQVALNGSGDPVRDYKKLNGVTTVENDVVYLRLDRQNLGAGTYHGTLTLRTTAGSPKIYQIKAVVPGLQGEWKGFATISTVNGKRNPVPDIDLFVSFYEDTKIVGLMRGAIDSTNALLWPVDVPLIGYRQNNQGNIFQLTGSFVLPPGDQNNEPLDVFDYSPTGNDANWNKSNAKIDTTNPFPFPIHRLVTMSGSLLKGDPMTGYTVTGNYSEVVTGMSPQPIRLEGTFTLDRSQIAPFASRRTKSATDTGIEPVVIKQDQVPHSIGGGGNNFASPYKLTINTEQEIRSLSLSLNWSTLGHTNLIVTLVAPSGQTLLVHNGVALSPDTFKSITFPDNRPPVGSLFTFLNAVTASKGDWLLRIQNQGASAVTLSNWSLRLEGQAVTDVVGQVKNGSTGVANVPVTLTGFPYSQTAITDASGNFTLTRVPIMPVNFTVNSPAYGPANAAIPGLSISFTAPQYSNLNPVEAAYAAAFQAMPAAPVLGSGVSGYGSGTGSSPFLLNVVPVVTSGPASIAGGPLIGFAPLYADLAAVNTVGGVNWNFGDGTTSIAITPPQKTWSAPKAYTVTLDSPVGGALESTKQVIALPTVRNAPANPAAVVAGGSSTPYVAYCFQPFFTSGGALPKGVLIPTTVGNNIGLSGAKFVELFMIQHTYAANFDLDLAPKTTVNSDYSTDSFANFAPSTFVLHPSNDAVSDPLNVGYQQEDHNYTLGSGVWISSQALNLDLGQDRSYTVEDTILHPPDRAGAVGDGVNYARYRMTCNVGPTLLPGGGLGSLAVQTTAVHANPATRPPLVEGASGLAKNLHYIMLTGPLAQDWAYQSAQP